MADVQFTDNSVQVKGALEDAVLQWLEESANEIQSAAERNSDFAPRSLKGGWKHIVDENKKVATVGHPAQLAIWMEFGTGEYAINGDGRKGGWAYVDEEGNRHFTMGKKPSRAMWNAYTSLKSKIIKHIQDSLKGL